MYFRFYQFLIPLVALLFAACTKEPMDIETVTLTDDLYIEVTDTITPQYTVYRLDSFATSGGNMAIIGSSTDPVFGRIEAQTFARFKLATNNYQTVGAENEYFDSVVLIMHTDSSFYGDTMSTWSINIHALRQLFESDHTYYNHHSLWHFEASLGQQSVTFRPNVDDSVRIILDPLFGQELFNLYKTKNRAVETQHDFQQYFKGLAIAGSSSNNVIYRFPISDSTFTIRLYYHEDLGNIVRKHLDFSAEGGSYQFNNIVYDPSGTALASVAPGEERLSGQLNNQFFVNDLAGIGTEIRFPSTPVLATLPNYVRVADAVLQIKPAFGSYAKFPLIPYLGMQLTNETNLSATPLYSADGSYIQDGNLLVDDAMTEKTSYTYDVGALIRSEIVATPATAITVNLQPYSSSLSGSFSMQRLVANDNLHPTRPSQLQIQTIFYKKQL